MRNTDQGLKVERERAMPSPDALALRTPGQTCGHEPNCGCHYAGCCFECPLPECKFEGPFRSRAMVSARRAEARWLQAKGVRVKDITFLLGVSRVTVWTYLRDNHNQ